MSLPSQRHLFDLPREVAYLNAASSGLLPRSTLGAVAELAARKGQAWTPPNDQPKQSTERLRMAAARLINASSDDVAHMPSVGLAVAQVGRILDIPRGSRVLVMQDDHASPVFEWVMRADRGGFTVETVAAPPDGNWTAAILAAIERPAAPPLSLLSVSTLHWTEGCLIDAAAITTAAQRQGARVLLDATQTIGVVPLDVQALDPDFVTFVSYKWLLGPYGRSYLYVAKRHQNGIPIDQTMSGRRDVRAEADVYFGDTRYVDNARRFDIGQRDHTMSMDMAAIGAEQVLAWGVREVEGRLRALTGLLAEGLSGLPGYRVTPAAHRSPHILVVRPITGPMPQRVVQRLAAEQVFSCIRIGGLRLAPHVYVDDEDITRAVQVLRKVMSQAAA